MKKVCPINKFLDCPKEKCAWWIYKPELTRFNGAKGYDVITQEKVECCAIKLIAEKLNEKSF